MSNNGNFFMNLSNDETGTVLADYSYEDLCMLSEAQIDIYMDETNRNECTIYNNPYKINLDENYSVNEIKKAIHRVSEIFPVLSARIVVDGENVSFAFDADFPVIEGTVDDAKSFVVPFNLERNLSKFLIVEDTDSKLLYIDLHQLIFDSRSLNILLNALGSVLKGYDCDFVDDGALRRIALENTIIDSDYKSDAGIFYESMLCDQEEVYELLPSIKTDFDDNFRYVSSFDMDLNNLDSFLQNNSISRNQFFTSVFAYNLSRFAGSSKVLFNLIEDVRGQIDSPNAVGMLSNTLPLLFDCKNQNVNSYLKYSANLIDAANGFALYPFQILKEEYGLNSDILFQCVENDFDVEELRHDMPFDLSFYISCENAVEIKVLYSDKYSKDFIEHFVDSFMAIANSMMKVNELSDIDYVSSSDLEILDNVNKTEHDLGYKDILDAFNDNLDKTPNNILVSFMDKSYTYSEGAFIADKIAKRLLEFGVEAQDNVAFLTERSEYYMFSILSILSAGAVYVPLDDKHPDDRLQFILQDTESKVVIVSDGTYERAKELVNNSIVFNISDIVKDEIGSLSSLPVTYNDLGCILYTSGTTGLPKGVKVPRIALVNLSSYYVRNYGLTNDDVFGLYSSIGFDAACKAIFAAIYAGSCLDVIPNDVKLDINALNNHFKTQGINHVDITTQVAKLLVSQIDDIPLDVLFTGGEKLGEFDEEVNCRFVDGYGPTEAYVEISTIEVLERIDSSSIGHLVDNMKAYILDDEGRRVPVGAVGELYLSGYQVADGYLNREDETEKAFLDNNFLDDENYATLYRTGDIVRLLPDGTLGIVGRRDSQVKIRGNRVELSEIESVIREVGHVEDLTLQTVKRGTNNELVAYVVSSLEDDDAVADSICDYVRDRKPEYMVPSFVICLDEIPLNVNGKVDKRALPEVDVTGLRAEYVAPTTEIEKQIVSAFEKVFNQEGIGIYDDFVRLGGDSLSAIKLLYYIDEYNLSAANILSLRTPKAISESVNVATFDLDTYSLESGCPLNEPQLNVYLDIMANDKSDSYIIPVKVHVPKDYSLKEITDALDEMFRVHPILEMRISKEFDVPYLVKGNKPVVSFESSDFDRDSILEFISEPFDLEDCMCRFLIVEDGDGYDLFAVFHHLIFDGFSVLVFEQDLFDNLNGKSLDVDDSFLKVSAFSNQITETEDFDEAALFYQSMLADVDESAVLLGNVSPDGPGDYNIDLNADVSKFLEKYNVSENVLFTGVFAYTLSRFVGDDNVFFNIVENGRDRFKNFNSIGMFVNTLPIMVDCKNRDVGSFLNHMSDVLYNVMGYNYYPFRLLANDYDINSDILFQYRPDWFDEGQATFVEDIDDEIEEKFIGEMGDSVSDLSVVVTQNSDDYNLDILYSDKFSKEFIERIAESFKLILHDIIDVDELSDINYISSSDLMLLDSYNETDHPLDYEDIMDAFNDNLSKCPDNKLVSCMDRSYSYAEGAFIADKIAKQLIELGVVPQDNVAFLTQRSEHYMFSSLGIVSLGAIYVPLDVNHPDERLEFILKDTDSKVIIVTDETYERAKNLSDVSVLNISEMVQGDIGTLDSLPVVYGDLACMLYTSGTTGVPKGVKITRKSLLNLSQFFSETYDFTNGDVYALYSSISFDAGPQAVFQSLYAGACLSVVPEDIKFNIQKLNEYFIRQNVTHTFVSTQVGKMFMEQIDDTSLKVLSVGGEKLGNVKNPEEYMLVDEFGPTEAFAFISSIENSDKVDESSIGFFNYNSKEYILDAEGRRVPLGAVGELCISGYQVADGYLNRDEETNKSFLDNPFDSCEGHDVLYRTGDLVRMLPDGSLGIVGRMDEQVKIRGNRVELSEIESVIRELDYVDDVTVQTIKHGSNNELVSYVVISKDMDENVLRDGVCDYVSKNKPDFMIPSYVIRLDSIPLNVNGKVDKHALPKVDLTAMHVEYVAATNETEQMIIDAFESVFNIENIGLFDDFVRLGGDSISAIRVITMLQKNGVSCTARDILNHKTPYLIAQNLTEFEEDISFDPVEGQFDLLPIQSYFFKNNDKNEFSQQFILKSKVKLNPKDLKNAFDELSNIHDMLRAVYKFDDDGNPIQEVLPLNTSVCEVNEFFISDLSEFNSLFINSIKSLNIHDHLIDISLIHYHDADYILFVIHHLIIDGVSWNILLVDLTYIYARLLKGEEIDLSRPYPYKNWVEDVKKLADNISEEEKQHWIEVNEMLDDSNIKGESNLYAFNVEIDYLTDNLLMLSEEEYWALAIARAYKKTYGEDIIFNRESHGRDDTISNINRTVGWFTSQYPVPVDVSAEDDGISLINDVYTLKTAFKNIKNLGLNYGSLIYTTGELEFKNCPVTFNFLSSEFVFENMLFKSINSYLDSNDELSIDLYDDDFYGISINVSQSDDVYLVAGAYAKDTYIGDQYSTLVENIKNELKFIANYKFEDNIACCLSEPQMGVYLDEKVNDKGIAYSTSTVLDCDLNKSVGKIESAIHSLIDKHPILKGRILDNDDLPLLVCDSNPLIEVVHDDDTSSLVNPFNLEDYLARFYIVDTPDRKAIFFDVHHIISDATTISVIINDLNNALEGKMDDSVDLGFIYSSHDFFDSKFQSNYDSAHEFFANNFAEIDEIPTLMGDVDGSEGSVVLPIRGIKDKLEEFAHENGITIGNLLNAVFAYTYSRFTDSDKVYFNIMEHGRHDDYVQDAVGIFVRTIPLVIDCSNAPIAEYVSNVSDLVLNSMANSIYPFRLLASEFNLNNNIFFEYNSDLNDVSFICDEIILSDYAMDTVGEFSGVVNDLDDGYAISIDHSDMYSQETAKRFAYVFKEILTQIVDKTDLKDIDYVSPSDGDILDSYNETDRPLDYEDILDAFNDNLSKYPDNNLVLFKDKSYSYSEGAFIADKIAKKLSELGVGVQDNVAFLTERSECYMFSVLGILSLGAVYVPLDDNHPDDRLQFILEDTDSKVIIVSDETYERANKLSDATVLNISEILKEDFGSLDALPVVYGDLACMLYTSGTTGVPKGVKVTRKSVLNVCESYTKDYGLASDDVYALFSGIGFDVSSFVISVVMRAGACLAVVPEEIRLNMTKLNEYFISNDVSHAFITTQVGKLFMETVDETSLDVLLVAGEKLGEFVSPDDYELVDAYGPTEAFAFVTSINNSSKWDYSSVGLCNCNVKAYVLDDEFRRVPLGAVGELYLAGFQVADGYLNREEETQKAFLDNPYSDDENYATLYRTGDMVRLLPDGTLGIVGRRDSQVKIRGNRVELPEIESVIREVDHVDDVTLQTIKQGSNNELVAYIVSSMDDETGAEEDIKNHVLSNKPDYMVPSFIIFLDEIPLNVNGKVDKRALPEVNMSSLRAEFVAPKTKEEKLVVESFEKVFNQTRISLNDDFVQLGGDSLAAIKLLSHLDGYNITAAEILSLRTPFAIADSIKEFDFDLDIYSLDEGCPLNESQLNVYLDIIANSKTDSFIIPINIPIPEKYPVEDVVDALEKMLIVHPILEMRLSDEFDVPYLVKGNKPSISVESDISDEFGREFVTKPFDLEDSLCRFLIVKNDEIYYLFAVFHHLIFDGLSASVFEHDLFKILNGIFIDFDDSFLEVAAFNNQISKTDEFNDAALFYESMLADIDESGVLLDSICPDGPGDYSIDLDVDISKFLEKYDVSENVLFTSVFAYTLSRFMGDDKVFFNIVENGRDRFNNFNSIGMFVNTLPVLVDCKNQDIASFIEYMSDVIYGVIGYNYYPFRLLANEYDINSDILFQFKPDWFIKEDVMFSENEFDKNIRNGIADEMDDFITDLEVEVVQKGDEYSLMIFYSNKFSRDFIEHIGESFKLILHDFIYVDKLSDINYTSSSDLMLLDTYNETEHDFKYSDILDAFNDNLPKYENETLVGYKNKSYTHGQSAFIANEIANELSDMGIVHKDFVSLFVPRSELFLLTSLGVLAMGGAYVPIETTYPDERIILMLTDSESKAVIVNDASEEKITRIIRENNLNIDVLNISPIFYGSIGSLNHLDTVDVDEDDVACVLYTSGTTGTPKGSLTPRRSLNNFVSWYVMETNFTSEDVYGMHCSYVFDMHTHALYSPVITGGALYIVPEEIRLDLSSLNKYFVEHNCTHTFITSQVGKLFAESGMETSIKLLCFGGMKLGELNAPDSIGPFESYGPSENLAISTSIFANKRIHTSSIGRFISNVKGYVLDKQHRRVPFGAVGELYLAGKQLSLGYLNREEVNAKAFFDNPFDDLEGYERIYATGDVVRFLPDGTLGIVGRQDSQVKVRGNRVELPEVESVIRKIPFVEDVTVQTTVNNGNNELVAYVVVSDEANEDNLRNDIREYVSDRKPDYMVPSFVVKLDELPLNVNGKIDKRALPEVDLSNLGGEYVAPENDVEAFFVECFEELLGVSKVSTTDDFFEMGGDSMLVIKIIYKALNEGYSISYADLFNNPTPKSLSKIILLTQEQSEDNEEDYDYSIIHNLLNENNIDSFNQGKCDDDLGNVLLSGVTGFLGIHILNELLQNENGDVYCLIRPREGISLEDRFNELADYYFGSALDEFKDRVHLVEGDITNPDDFKKLSEYNIDTVINSAANVKHFAHGSEIKDINLYGAINALEFAKLKQARFVQVSTASVAGMYVEGLPSDIALHEDELYIGQDYISNKYIESKYLAERAILESAAEDDLDVKIMRVGNLMARSYDGKFQRNYDSNAFVNSLKSFVTIGKMPKSVSEEELELSPIDLTAKSVVLLSKAPKECTVFHPVTDKLVTFNDLVDVFNNLGLNVEIVDDEEFNQSLNNILIDESKQDGLFGIATELNDEDENIPVDTEYTLNVLSELGFEWTETTEKYLFEFIRILKELEFFNV